MLPQEIIRLKRDNKSLSQHNISMFVKGLADGSVSDAQAASFAMAVLLRGMTVDETAILTNEMSHSGKMLNWRRFNLIGPIIDKHSTGGLGDKVSLILAPAAAAMGMVVPMIAGRGLGHAGGTLDKLDSIPGYNSVPSISTFQQTVLKTGCAIIGQTSELAPADQRLYAIRDITATVESLPLITASILSKKLAAGVGGLSMDIKTGNGAFTSTVKEAQNISKLITTVGLKVGLPVTTSITDMSQPLGTNIGNALEVSEAVAFLIGKKREPRLQEVCVLLLAKMAVLGGLTNSLEEGKYKATAVLDNGTAAERFAEMVSVLGGPSDFLKSFQKQLPEASVIRACKPDFEGFIKSMDVRRIGLGVIELGGGRRYSSESINYAVGFSEFKGIGTLVRPDVPIALVHARDESSAERAIQCLKSSVIISNEAPIVKPLIYDQIDLSEE
jgi:thymidine phosphorylase